MTNKTVQVPVDSDNYNGYGHAFAEWLEDNGFIVEKTTSSSDQTNYLWDRYGNSSAEDYGDLNDINTGDALRKATRRERQASLDAAMRDGGVGAIVINGYSYYVG